jgi:hypothetical protein
LVFLKFFQFFALKFPETLAKLSFLPFEPGYVKGNPYPFAWKAVSVRGIRNPEKALNSIAAVAQLVERVLGKDEVMGSNPISSLVNIRQGGCKCQMPGRKQRK